MAKMVFGKRAIALVLALILCFSMVKMTVYAADQVPGGEREETEEAGNWSYAYYLGQEYLGNAHGAAVKPDPVGYGFQGVITSITFTDDAGQQWTFHWSSEANGEWRITGKGVSREKAAAWPQITDGKVYVGYCGGSAYTFTLSNDGSSTAWTYADNGHANWFRYIRFIREYTVNVFYQNETGGVVYEGITYAQQEPVTGYFTFYYPNGNIIDDSEYRDGEYTAPTTLWPESYLPKSMIDQGYEIKHATDAAGNDVTATGVTISLLGSNVLNVYCTLIPPVTENYSVVHNYYMDGTFEGTQSGGTIEVQQSSDFAAVVDGIEKLPEYNGATYTYISYAVDPQARVITLTYTRARPTYDYTVTYNANFGDEPEIKADAENVAGVHDTTKTIGVDGNSFVREGYRFLGWATEPQGGVVYQPGMNLTFTMGGSKELFAVWEAVPKYSYSLVYAGNGGALVDGTAQYTDLESVQNVTATTLNIGVDDNSFLRENHTFVGWNTEADGSGTAYAPGSEVVLTAGNNTEVLYAQWQEDPRYDYTVIYNANFGTDPETKADSESITGTYATEYGITVDANSFVRENYTFTGWNTAPDGSGTAYQVGGTVALTAESSTETLYAQWQEDPRYDYTVIYNANFGTEPETKADEENVTQVYDTTKAIGVDGNSFVRENYDFIGWSTEPEGPVIYLEGDILSFEKGGSQILYAQWNEHSKYSYTLVYNGNGGALENGELAYGDAQNVQDVYATARDFDVDENTFLRENHTFLGWNTEADGSGTAYAPEDTLHLTAEDNVRTLYAQWQEAPKYDYTVIYNANFGEEPETTADDENVTGVYDTTKVITIDPNHFTREHYTFLGWAEEPLGQVVYQPGEELTFTRGGSQELFAVWEIVAYGYTVEYLVKIDDGEFQLFAGKLPEGTHTGGKLPYGTIVGEEIAKPPAALTDEARTYTYLYLEEIVISEGANVVRVYYLYETPAPPDPPEVPTDPDPTDPTDPPETPDDPVPQSDDDPIEIPDEDVPLAEVPVTGDPMLIYAALTVLSGGGLIWLGRKKEDEEA